MKHTITKTLGICLPPLIYTHSHKVSVMTKCKKIRKIVGVFVTCLVIFTVCNVKLKLAIFYESGFQAEKSDGFESREQSTCPCLNTTINLHGRISLDLEHKPWDVLEKSLTFVGRG